MIKISILITIRITIRITCDEKYFNKSNHARLIADVMTDHTNIRLNEYFQTLNLFD